MIKLIGERLLVRPFMRTITQGGIIIPDTKQDIPTIGQITMIGNIIPELTGCRELKIGDWIKFQTYVALPQSDNWIKVDSELLLIVRPNDVIGIVDKPEMPKVVSTIIADTRIN